MSTPVIFVEVENVFLANPTNAGLLSYTNEASKVEPFFLLL